MAVEKPPELRRQMEKLSQIVKMKPPILSCSFPLISLGGKFGLPNSDAVAD